MKKELFHGIHNGFRGETSPGEAGATGTTEVKNVKDLSLTLESGDADVTTRAANGWKVSQKTLRTHQSNSA
jgi:hypothetical protein